MAAIKAGILFFAPVYIGTLFDSVLRKMVDDAWKGRLDPKWRLRPAPSINFSRPIVSDTLIPMLEAGSINSVPGIRRVLNGKEIELDNGEIIEVEAIIFCTGYTRSSHLTTVVQFEGDLPLARLYQNVFHPNYPDSLAYMTFWHLSTGVCEIADLMAMGIAQVFSGRYQLPPLAIMNKQIDTAHAYVRGLASRSAGPIAASAAEKLMNEGPWRAFLNEAAGTQINEMLGYGLQGWYFWLTNRKLSAMLMTGVDSPHIYRLFQGRARSRMRWEGAQRAIEQANSERTDFEKRNRDEEARKKGKAD